MAIQRRRRHPGGRSRRRTTWATHESSEVFAAANDLHTVNLLDQYQTAGGTIAGISIARTLVRMTVPTAVTAGDTFDFGLLRGQDTDVGVNIAGAPSPSSHLFEDWAWLTRYQAGTLSGAGPHYSQYASNVIELDIRSRRRLPELQMSWNWAVHVGQAMTINLFARTLIMLP